MRRVVNKKALLAFCMLIGLSIQNIFAVDVTVTSNADSGPGTLRDAITQVNGSSGPSNSITFELDNLTISLLSSLDPITSPVVIDGENAKPSPAPQGNVIIDGSNITSGQNIGLMFSTSFGGSDSSVLKNFSIQNFTSFFTGVEAVGLEVDSDNISVDNVSITGITGNSSTTSGDSGINAFAVFNSGQNTSFSNLTIGSIQAGNGADAFSGDSGSGGKAIGLQNLGNNAFLNGNTTISDLTGGNAGGGASFGSLNYAGGDAIGVNNLGDNIQIGTVGIITISDLNSGNGGNSSGLSGSANGGNGGNAIGVQNDGNSNIVKNTTLGAMSGGDGGILSTVDPNFNGSGGIGGNVIAIDDAGNGNQFLESSISQDFVTNSTAGTKGCDPNGNKCGSDGSVSGVLVVTGIHNTVQTNSIYGNTNKPGIRLAVNGNEGQSAPVLNPVELSGNSASVSGILNSDAGTYTFQLFNNSTSSDTDQGRVFLGSESIVIGSVDKNFEVTIDNIALSAGDYVTATVTDSDGNTSEFSQPIQAIDSNNPIANNGLFDVCSNLSSFQGQLTATPVNPGATLIYTISTQPQNGTVVLNNANTGNFTYTSDNQSVQNDEFTFYVTENGNQSNTATVSITTNECPTADNKSFSVCSNLSSFQGQLTATPLDVNLTYTIATQPQNGTVALDENTGNFTYTSDNQSVQNDEFTFFVTNENGNQSNTATVSITANDCTVTGTDVRYLVANGNELTIEVSGATPGSEVELYVNQEKEKEVVVAEDGTANLTETLPDGDNIVQVSITDPNGNTVIFKSNSVPVPTTNDVSINGSAANGLFINGNTSSPATRHRVTRRFEPRAVVELIINGRVVSRTRLNSDGTYSFRAPQLAPGRYVFRTNVADEFGNIILSNIVTRRVGPVPPGVMSAISRAVRNKYCPQVSPIPLGF